MARRTVSWCVYQQRAVLRTGTVTRTARHTLVSSMFERPPWHARGGVLRYSNYRGVFTGRTVGTVANNHGCHEHHDSRGANHRCDTEHSYGDVGE
jgi:hypothetical protein